MKNAKSALQQIATKLNHNQLLDINASVTLKGGIINEPPPFDPDMLDDGKK